MCSSLGIHSLSFLLCLEEFRFFILCPCLFCSCTITLGLPNILFLMIDLMLLLRFLCFFSHNFPFPHRLEDGMHNVSCTLSSSSILDTILPFSIFYVSKCLFLMFFSNLTSFVHLLMLHEPPGFWFQNKIRCRFYLRNTSSILNVMFLCFTYPSLLLLFTFRELWKKLV